MNQTVSTAIPMQSPVLVPVVGTGASFPVRRVYCVGRNYADHAREMGYSGREAPFFFLKPADAIVVVPEEETGTIRYPLATSNLHHEVELVVAIGTGGENIPAADARRHVFGYAVGLDMTRRDLQAQMKKDGRPWEVSKAFDQSAPMGPIRPVTQTGWIEQGAISLQVDGQPRQNSTLDQMIWNVAETIEHLSRYWALAPGDLIFTGTPEGVGPVERGQTLLGHIDGVGSLQVSVA